MRISSALAILAFAVAPARAEMPIEDVPGHPGVSYADLMKQAMPDLALRDDGAWAGTIPGKDGGDFAFASISALKVREAGKTRLLLLTDSEASEDFTEILAVFDDAPATPRLLDTEDVGNDRLVSFGAATMPLAEGTDLFFVENQHSNSDQSYLDTAAMFLADGKLKLAAEVFTFSEALCAYETTQTPAFKTVAEKDAKYRAVVVSVAVKTTLSDLECSGDAKRPKPGTRVWRDTYRWDAAKREYRATTHALDRLAKENEKRF
jgi:hypothetical protein